MEWGLLVWQTRFQGTSLGCHATWATEISDKGYQGKQGYHHEHQFLHWSPRFAIVTPHPKICNERLYSASPEQPERIHRSPPLEDSKVQMRASAVAGGSEKANAGTLIHDLAGSDIDAVKMGI